MRCCHPSGRCTGRADVRGLCRRHYQRWRRTGAVGPVGPVARSPVRTTPPNRGDRAAKRSLLLAEILGWLGTSRQFRWTARPGKAVLTTAGQSGSLIVPMPTLQAWIRYGWIASDAQPRFEGGEPGVRLGRLTAAGVAAAQHRGCAR